MSTLYRLECWQRSKFGPHHWVWWASTYNPARAIEMQQWLEYKHGYVARIKHIEVGQ